MLLLALVLPYIPYVSEPFSPARRVEAAVTMTVTTTADTVAADGQCSLREALQANNTNATVNECIHNGTGGLDTINFNIAGAAPYTFSVASALPIITQPVLIDGRSEPDFAGAPIIVLNGEPIPENVANEVTNGLTLASGSSGSTIRGLVIQNFNNSGIQITSSSNNVIVGNRIGTNQAGTARAANRGRADGAGIEIIGPFASNNTIGGTTGVTVGGSCTGDCNLVSGNADILGFVGVKMRDNADNNIVISNYIGTDVTGTLSVPNERIGLQIIGADGNRVGGNTPAERNVISGNAETNFVIISYGTDPTQMAENNIIEGNYVGLNSPGTGDISVPPIIWPPDSWNYSDGMRIRNSPSNTITGNYVSGNDGTAIRIQTYGFLVSSVNAGPADNMVVTNNFIGTDGSGTGSVPNGEFGVFLQGASNALIQGNVINNNNRGIVVDHEYYATGPVFIPSLNNLISQNTIQNNTNLGIDIVERPVQSVPTFGVTANDGTDADGGNNDQQNFPVLTSANVVSGPSLSVSGNLTTIAGTYLVEFFSSPSCDASGNGEGATYLGSTSVVVASTGVAQPFTATGLPNVTLGHVITSTATSNNGAAGGETSEFSGCATVASALPTVSIDDPGAFTEGTGAGSTTITYTVTLSAASGSTVTVPFTVGGTASGGGVDYTFAPISPLSFSPGVTTQNIVVTVNRDSLDENDETVVVTLGAPTGANLDSNPASTIGDATITDDDDPPTVSIDDVAVTEGTGAGSTTLTLTVTLSAVSGLNIQVPFTAADVTATAADYTVTTTGPLILNSGDTSETISVTITRDALNETNETFNVQLGAPSNATLDPVPANTLGVGTINDDDAQPTVSIDDVIVAEDAGTLTFTVTLSAASGQTVIVPFTPAAGTATTPADYAVTTTSPLTFNPGVTTQSVVVNIVDDALDEDDETFTVTLGAPTNATLDPTPGNEIGTGTITDNDTPPTVSIDDVTVAEDGGTLTFTVTLSAVSGRTVTAPFLQAAGTATTPADYAVTTISPLTFNAGTTTQSVVVNIVDDALDENTEDFTVTLQAPTNADLDPVVANRIGVGTITDNDAPPTVSINDVAQNEGAGTLTFTVTLSAASGRTVTVPFVQAAGTATTPADYSVATISPLTFNAGVTTQSITVNLVSDTIDEPNEDFTVTLQTPTNADLDPVVANTIGVGTINDDDNPPTISINDVALGEGSGGGTTTMNFTVTLSSASAFTVTAPFIVADGTAVSPADYTVSTSTPLTFNPGITTLQVQALIVRDNIDEPVETFTITLDTPTNATLDADPAAIVGVGTILDDDNAPVVSIDDVAMAEGTGGITTLTLTVSLSNPSSQTVTVPFTSANGTATLADYSVTTGTPLLFNPGTTTQSIAVDIVTDALDENDEDFTVTLLAPTNATLDPVVANTIGVGTINDDDDPPTVSIDDVTVNESAGTLTFTVTLSAVSGLNVSVPFSQAAGTATTPADYSVTTISPINIAAGLTTQTITVNIVNDTTDEPAEDFTVTLQAPTNAALDPVVANTIGVGTITDNDNPPTVSINDVAVTEGTGGITTLTYTVTLSAASGFTVSVPFISADGTATTPADYSVTTISPLSFSPGTVTQSIAVNIVTDAVDEDNEDFTVTLQTPTNADLDPVVANTIGVGTINDDDGPPLVSINDMIVNENAGTLTFTVSLSASSGQTITVPFIQAAGTATTPADYNVATISPLTFNPGDTSETITVNIVDDVLDEDNETFTVTLQAPTNAVLDPTPGNEIGTGTITDNDASPTVSIDDVTANESAGTLTFTVTLSAVSGRTVTAPFVQAAGTATTPADYAVATVSPLTFTAGTTTQSITVNIVNDALDENDETFTVTLQTPTNADLDPTPGNEIGTGTITDDDAPPTVSIDDVTVAENAGTLTFTVTLSAASGRTVTVPFVQAAGTATTPADYAVATISPLTFTAGTTTQSITVNIVNDTLDENNEDFTVTLQTPTNADLDPVIANTIGVGTITDNDNPPTVSIDDVTVAENAGTLTFTVSLSTASGLNISVPFTSAGGTAAPIADYAVATGSPLTFTAGTTTQSITVNIVDDLLDEANEDFTVTLDLPTNADLDPVVANTIGVGTITDNDNPPTVSIDDVTANESAGTLTFTVTLSAMSGQVVSVPFAQAAGTATTPADYSVATISPLTFNSGVTTQSVTVNIVNDTTDEPAEDFTVTLGAPTNADLDPTPASTIGVGTITDNDNPPTVSIDDVAVTEGTGIGTTTLTYTVSLSQASGFTVSVPFTVADVTATDPADYSVTTISPLTFNPGITTQSIAVDIVRDATDEPNETFEVTLGAPTNATLDPVTANTIGVGTINNDDGPPLASINDVTVNENAGTLTFTVSLSAASGLTVTVPFIQAAGTATTPADYAVATISPLTFTPGDTSETITVNLVDDLLDENNETFTVTLGTPTNADLDPTPGNEIGTGTINDDDALPTVSIDDVTANESAGTLTFTVTLSAVSGRTVTVPFAQAAGTATTPADYAVATISPLTFTSGVTTQSVTVNIVNDTTDEPAEDFTVTLQTPTNADLDPTPASTIGVGTITDNDNPPTVSIDDVAVTEGTGIGTTTLTYTVSLSQASGFTVSVPFTAADVTATDPADYSVATISPLTFAPGITTQSIAVDIVHDATDEPNETFEVTLGAPTNADLDPTPANTIGVGTINNDDGPPLASINDVTVNENAGTLTFTVSLSAASGLTVTVPFTSAAGTATTPADYAVATISPLTFTPGDTSETITVNIVNDTLDENNETFTVTLGTPTNADLDPTPGNEIGTGTINDDDAPPSVSIDDVAVTEGTGAGTTTLTYTVALSTASGLTVTVPFTAADGTATGADYSVTTVSPLTFNPGVTTQTIAVNIVRDALDENNEDFTVTLGAPTNATLDLVVANTIGVGTINDDDAAPTVSIDDVAVTEGTGAGTTTLTFTATLSAPSGLTVTVPFTSADGTATAADYSVTTVSPLTFNAGVTTQTIAVNIVRDATDEPNETFTVTLGAPTNATLDPVVANTIGVGAINDDDNAPTVSIDDVAVTEGTGGTTTLTFTVTLSAASGLTVTVPFTSANGTATAADYSVTTVSPLTFNVGVTTQTIAVNIVTDNIDENNETFTVTLGAPTNATVDPTPGAGVGIGTINDDDNAPVVSINDVTVTEGTGGTNTLTFTVSLSNPSSFTVTVPFTSANGTATAADYSVTTVSPLTFNAGVTSQSISVNIVTDATDENNEDFSVTLQAPTNATLDPTPANTIGVGTINDDDAPPTVSIDDVAVTEGTGVGTTNLTFTVTLSAASDFPITVPFTVAGVTAATPADFSVTTVSPLSFAAGTTTRTIVVSVVRDAVDENNETLNVTLGAPTNATLDPTPANTIGVGTINDDDSVGVTVTITGGNTTVVESPAPTPAQRDTFNVRLASQPTANVTITVSVSDGQTLIGRVGGPYSTSLNLTFVPSGTPTAPNTVWDTNQIVEVMAVDDLLAEPNIHTGVINFAVQAGSAAEYIGLSIPSLNVRVRDNDGRHALALFNSQTSQASLLDTLQDLPPSSSYNTFAPGAPINGQWIMGDWDGDGQQTPGVYGNGVFAYTNAVGPVPPASWIGIWFGLPGPAVPGHFDAGVGHDCIGVIDSGNFPPYGTAYVLYFACDLTSGPTPPLSFQWLSVVLPDNQGFTGTPQFVAGDWDADGADSVAVRRSEFIAYTNVPPAPNAPSLSYSLAAFNLAQYIGDPRPLAGDVLAGQYGNVVSGDWDADGIDSFGLYYPAGYFYYRNDLLWNSGLYTLQRVAQPIGTTTVATSWRAGTTGGAGVAEGQPESTPTPTVPTTRRITTVIESDDPQVVREGTWMVQNAAAASGNRYVYSSGSTDDILTLEFVGTSVEVIYIESQMTGTFTIVVDDIAVRTVITTGDATEFNSRTLINYLADGQHTLEIVPISGTVAVDAFVVTQEITE